jgi:hypothetical protein
MLIPRRRGGLPAAEAPSGAEPGADYPFAVHGVRRVLAQRTLCAGPSVRFGDGKNGGRAAHRPNAAEGRVTLDTDIYPLFLAGSNHKSPLRESGG